MKNVFTILILWLSTGWLFAQQVTGIERVSITVSDLDRVSAFYEEVLTFKRVATYHWEGPALQQFTGLNDRNLSARVARLRLGEEEIELVEYIDEERRLPVPADSRSNDLWFQHIAIVVSDIEEAFQHLMSHGVTFVSTSPQTLPENIPAAAGISAFYFRDPDGHNLELIHFPAGKGDSRWMEPTNELFLGIDHTAIGVEATAIALDFYAKTLGLRVAGNSRNFGTEQEHLNQVFGAHLLITGLRAPTGFGLEFLDYLAPPGGRPYPPDSRPTDLWHWHTTISVVNAEMAYERLTAAGMEPLSSSPVRLGNKAPLSFLARGPDGHVLHFIQTPKHTPINKTKQ